MYETFPHEIGLFLGYPEEDVQGFIEIREKIVSVVGVGKYIAMNVMHKKCFVNLKNVSVCMRGYF